MMISYPGLSKLKTNRVVYQDVYTACDVGTLEQIKEVSSKRKAIEDSLNGNITEAIAREMSGGLTSRYEQDIQKLEQYLPLLENMCFNSNIADKNRKVAKFIPNPEIRWSSVLRSSPFPLQGQSFYQIKCVYFDHAMTLSLYASLLHERALEVLSSHLVQSATLLRKAAGVYSNVAQRVVKFKWTPQRPAEASPIVCNIMSLICLAEAQAVTARKAEENGKTGSLLAKLHFGVKEFLDQAIDMLPSLLSSLMDVSSHFKDFCFSCRMLHELKSYKYYVESLKNDGKIGIAIAVLRRALANSKKYTPKEKSWWLVSKQIIDELQALLRKYEHENEFVWYEKIASDDDDLPSPQAVRIVQPIPYQRKPLGKTLHLKC